jgi:Zn-dependent protease
MEAIILIILIAYSIILHEIAHGYVAYKLGDPTAKVYGRLTLNPLAHIDPIGTIILPLMTFFFGGFIFGWAKPVPYNPYYFRNPKRDSKLVGLAGPLVNFCLAILFSMIIKFNLLPNIYEVFLTLIRINFLLAVFNLLPIPPLDGSRLYLPSLPLNLQIYLENIGFILIFFALFFLWPIIRTIVDFLMNIFI